MYKQRTELGLPGPGEEGNVFSGYKAALLAQMVKNLPAVQETWVRSLGWEDVLEEGMATHCSILAWRIPWTEEPGGRWSVGSQSWTRLSGEAHTCKRSSRTPRHHAAPVVNSAVCAREHVFSP